jgi:hypothetical protein
MGGCCYLFSRPIISIQTPILNGLADVGGEDFLACFKIDDGASDFEDAIIGSGGEAFLGDGLLQQSLAGVVDRTIFANQARPHLGVGKKFLVGVALLLDFPCRRHALAYRRGVFGCVVGNEFPVLDGGNVDVNVDTVDQWPGNSRDVLLDLRG